MLFRSGAWLDFIRWSGSKGGRKINAWWGRALRIEVAVDPLLSVQKHPNQILFEAPRRLGQPAQEDKRDGEGRKGELE